MKSLGGCPPWAVLHDMIDAADSDRNGEVISRKNFLFLMINLSNFLPYTRNNHNLKIITLLNRLTFPSF